jgi:hypothetical protein
LYFVARPDLFSGSSSGISATKSLSKYLKEVSKFPANSSIIASLSNPSVSAIFFLRLTTALAFLLKDDNSLRTLLSLSLTY